MDGLKGRVALITGGAAGIGRAIALRLAREGCKLGLIDIDSPRTATTAAELRKLGASVAASEGDVAAPGTMVAAVSSIIGQIGEIDILVNNAGIARIGPLLEISERDWRDIFAVNVDGVFHTCRIVMPAMVRRRRGAVINITSWLGKRGMPNYGAYAASKFALVGFTQTLALEVAAQGVRVNAVCPGMILDTAMREAIDAECARRGWPQSKDRAGGIPLGRGGVPDEVARVVAFLASDEAAYVTGSAYDIAGGAWLS
jgi:NAD(P)-dependent dehydrogenase (short-subunit alcohol dehydrogenase family)